VSNDEPAPAPTPPPRRRGPQWRHALRWTAVVLLGAATCAAGIAAYINERNDRQHLSSVGAPQHGTWLELTVWVQRVDVNNQQLVLNVLPVPHGTIEADAHDETFAQDVQLLTPSLLRSSVTLAKGSAPTLQQVSVTLNDGTVTDYPFDNYFSDIAWAATSSDGVVPVAMDFENLDPFFSVRPSSAAAETQGIVLETRISRSRGTFILAWFMMAAMWALSLAVVGGATVMVRKRRGLVWPAMGWMAATTFALVGLRNAAPGSPPIGSLIDYAAFFWAEAVTVASLTWTAVAGIQTELTRPDPTQ
jgi:hypothetical protein